MSRNFSVTEPHPSVAKSGGYIYGGRGGAGNYKRYNSTDLTSGPTATGPASRISLPLPPRRVVGAGRGGAGNFYTPTQPEEQIFQFDEEMVKRRESQAPVYHIGRGGAANFVDETKPRTARLGSTGSAASVSSEGSAASSVRRSVDGALGKIARKLGKN